jgi:hypothetical protein
MTISRSEIDLEGSNDGKTWLAYELEVKPGSDLKKGPAENKMVKWAIHGC